MMASEFVWPWDQGPDLSRREVVLETWDTAPSNGSSVEWIDTASRIAQSGKPQLVLVFGVILWVAASAGPRARRVDGVARPKASRIRPLYEIVAQLTRAAALALLIVTAVRDPTQWINTAPVALAFLLGLTRLSNSLRWRHTALHQVNVLIVSSFAVLAAEFLLPNLKLHGDHEIDRIQLAAICTLGASIVVAVFTPREWIPPVVEKAEDYDLPEFKPNPEETCSWFVRYLTFEYMFPLIWTAWRRDLSMDDLFPLPWYDDPLVLLRKITKSREKNKTTLRTIFGFQRAQLLTMCWWIAMTHVLSMLTPFTMYQLLEYIDNPADAVLHPSVWLILLFVIPIMRSMAFQQYVFTSTRLVVRCKSAMTQELYHRAMSCMELEEDVINSIATRGAKEDRGPQSTSAGRLANLMSSDLDAIFRMRDSTLGIIGVPISILLTGFALWKVTGWPGLVGMSMVILASPLPIWLSRLMNKAQRKIKIAQDSRISLITEYLGSIKPIKYFAWEDAVFDRVQTARAEEQNQLWHLDVFATLIGKTSDLYPIVALLVTFALYTGVLGQPLTAAVAFTTLSLVNQMRRNLSIMTWVTRTLTDAFISLDRLDRYFANTEPLQRYPKGPLVVQNATFRRTRNASFRLRDISVDFVEGGLNVISGQSGSGKTSLLLAMLGELVLESGSVTSPGDIAFASQSAWLQNETIRENIIFNSPFEQARYDRVIEACCFGPDLKELSKGDQTDIGENGTILSGGQKSRVALARALYSKASVVFLDDIFSALDAKTAAAVWDHCFCTDMLKGRTIVLVTQVPWIPPQADLALTMDNGHIQDIERNIGVVRKPVAPESTRLEGESSNGATSPTTDDTKKPTATTTPPPPQEDDKIAEEMGASGRVSRLVALQYIKYYGGPLFLMALVVVNLLTNFMSLGTTYWLSIWVDAYGKNKYVDVAFYAGVYAIVSLLYSALEAAEYLVYIRGSWKAARQLHKSLLRGVLSAPISWWKDIPVGRVVNRFSRDIKSMDNNIGDMLYIVADTAVGILFRVGAASSILPIFMLPALFSVSIGVFCGEMYTRAGIVLQRIVRAAHSPVFSQYSDSMTGLTVIRSQQNMPVIFCNKLAQRMRPLSRAQEASFNSNRWIAVRVDAVTAFVSLCAGIIAVWKSSSLGAGLVGFSLSNITGLSGYILMLVRCLNQLEVEFQGFQRVEEYIKLEPEEKPESTEGTLVAPAGPLTHAVPADWPRTGSVELRNVTIRYDPDGPDILKDINLKFEAGERVAVIGRTGSGKSTLVLSLLRFTHIVSGQILYDGIDITTIPRKRLRQALTVIPQEAVLFNGTLQTNLDPSGSVPPDILENALESCHGIASFQYRGKDTTSNPSDSSPDSDTEQPTEQTPLLSSSASTVADNGTTNKAGTLTLSMKVTAKGENFSHGQRQVLSLCRALIRKSRLMLLDEATASMDYETDRGVQSVLRSELKSDSQSSTRTLVTIAHRLQTIIDYDKVVVLGGGRVLEFGSPRELYSRKKDFWDMVKHSGEQKVLSRYLEGDDGEDGNDDDGDTEVGSDGTGTGTGTGNGTGNGNGNGVDGLI
ncbi:multidrug resistance-associated protein [Echria macrotheca]|uniref:Multidrug resistance-associated protein n=1 Tax=Echria macrotheca TaxID=438768 RepID=A0AAJ0F9X7_9PEZI|nr:multidrug resistance-associated protein [Echria macrotheca]